MYRMRNAVNVDSKAPSFRALDIRGAEFNTATCLGRTSLALFFYRNGRCQTCREELKSLGGGYRHIAGQDGEVVAISTDSFDEAKNLAVDLQLPFKVISDPEHLIIDLYGVFDRDAGMALPAIILIDKAGIVRYRKIIEGLDDLVRGEEIANRLRDLKTGRTASHGGFNPMPQS